MPRSLPARLPNISTKIQEYLVGIAFQERARKEELPQALSLIRTADLYDAQDLGGATLHMGLFCKNGLPNEERRASLAGAVKLIDLVRRWPGTHLFVSGELVTLDPILIRNMLSCFRLGLRAKSQTAWCNVVLEDPELDRKAAYATAVAQHLSDLTLEHKKRKMTAAEKKDREAILSADAAVAEHIRMLGIENVRAERYVCPCRLLAQDFKMPEDADDAPAEILRAQAIEAGVDLCPYFKAENCKPTGRPMFRSIWKI